jgi:hypothetical protein
LNQINDITDIITTTKSYKKTFISKDHQDSEKTEFQTPGNITTLEDASMSATSNITQPSIVSTLERINDLDLVESKIHSLKMQSEFETNL